MKVIELRDAFGIDNLKPAERQDAALRPGETRVRVRAASLNYRDLMTVKHGGGRGVQLPLIPLSDGAGEVVETGPGVSRVKPGDRVMGIFMQTWLAGEPTQADAASALGGALDGMLAEHVVLHENGLVRTPDYLSDEEAATLPCAAVTAWQGLMTKGGMQAGDTILVLGTGGVSVFALQFAGIAGARAIITSSSDAKLERAKELGAAHCINYRTTPDWDKKVLELTDGVGVDHVVEVGGVGTLEKSLQAVRVGGTVSLIGVLTGSGTM
ncbi:MAG: NAD(P)-dependent alcohol dehydrogenase, partial [Candidatus Tectomicrobia bacterium]|nr:NAD(P)-dependent alcohol dehydrogenase [Candidatus Tectomicrobia bacterium]